MRKTSLKSVKYSNYIYQNGEYIVIMERIVWIFHADGNFVAKKQNIRWPRKVTFLPGNRALIQGSKNYHYISLVDGADLWECPRPKSDSIAENRFAVSIDKKTICDTYYDRDYKQYVIQIKPEEQEYCCFSVPRGYRVLDHIFYDKDGILCGMESQGFQKGIYQMGIREIPLKAEGEDIKWRRLWTQNAQPRALYTDGEIVLNNDLSVFSIETNESSFLFENRDNWNPYYGVTTWTYDSEQNLLTACDPWEHENLVIDCKERRMIARYSGYYGNTMEKMYTGCLVGDEFWIGTPDGIVRKPFPLIEEMPEYEKSSRSLNLW